MADESHPSGVKTQEPIVISRHVIALVSLVVIAIAISFVFIEVVRLFLSALALAAICSVLAKPVYSAILGWIGGRKGIAASITLVLGIISVVAPLVAIGYLAALQASGLVQGAGQLFEMLSGDVDALQGGMFTFPKWVPFGENLAAAGPLIVEKAAQIMGTIASTLASSLSGLTNGTASFFLGMFTFLYAMFYFLPLESSAFHPILRNSGLESDLQEKLHDRIISISRATLKGTLLSRQPAGASAWR